MPKLNSGTDTKAEFADRVSVTKGRISQLIAQGLPVRADGRIDVEAGLSWIENHLDAARRNKGGGKAARSATLAAAKRMHERVTDQRAKLGYDHEKGDLIEDAVRHRSVFARAKADRDV